MKAFVVGFPKSGTSTIQEACTKSNLKSAHWYGPEGYCGELIYKRYLAGEDPLLDFAAYDVMAQSDVCRPVEGVNFWPNLDIALLLTIRHYHPECSFILNIRDPDKIISSISRWNNLRKRITQADIIGLPAGYGGEDAHLRNWIEGHYRACRSVFGNDKKFVELPIESDIARETLGKAVGTDIGWWGVANKNSNSPKVRLSDLNPI